MSHNLFDFFKITTQIVGVNYFKIVGVSIEITNENGQSAKDMAVLWNNYFTEKVSKKVMGMGSAEIYVLFSEYESDFTGKYTAIIGHKTSSLDDVPTGLSGWDFKGGNYTKFKAQGELPNAIKKTWDEIWSLDKELNRMYTVDFEIYGPKSQNGSDSEVDIYLAVHR